VALTNLDFAHLLTGQWLPADPWQSCSDLIDLVVAQRHPSVYGPPLILRAKLRVPGTEESAKKLAAVNLM